MCIRDSSNPGPAAAHFAEVEVDTYTGLCRVVDYLAVHDVGKALNPALCRGQVGSAVQQGMGPVSYTHLDVYKRQALHQQVAEQSLRLLKGQGNRLPVQ